MSQSGFERLLLFQVKSLKLRPPVVQYRFHPERRWTFDLAWPDRKLAVEVEGGIWIRGGGRHNRASGFEKDIEKYNEAAILGYAVLRVTTGQVKNGEAIRTIERALSGLGSRLDQASQDREQRARVTIYLTNRIGFSDTGKA